MKENSIYRELADKMGVPNSERFVKILEASFTPTEAAICHELLIPATCKEVAAALSMEEKEVSRTLDILVDKGALTRGETQFAFHPTLLAYHHDAVADTAPHAGPHAVPKKVKELWGDFFRNEWSYMFAEHIGKIIEATGRSLPIWPAIGAIRAQPEHPPRGYPGRRKLEAED